MACSASLRHAYAAARPALEIMAAQTPSGQRPLHAVACFNLRCCRGGPALVGGGESRVGPQDQRFCSRECFAAHIAMCREAQE